MPVIDANNPADQQMLAALEKNKQDWLRANVIAKLPSRAKRLEAVEAIGAEDGYAQRQLIEGYVTEIFNAKSANNKAALDASTARVEALDCLEEVS